MKKSLPAIFASVLAAAALISTLAGCDSDIEQPGETLPAVTTPSVTTTAPARTQMERTEVPAVTTEPENIDNPFSPASPRLSDYIDPAKYAENADERAAENGWIYLHDYFDIWDGYIDRYGPLFGSGYNVGEGIDQVNMGPWRLDYNVKVYGIELTFENGDFSSSDRFLLDGYEVLFGFEFSDFREFCEEVETLDNWGAHFPTNTIWLEATDEPLGEDEFTRFELDLTGSEYSNKLLRVRFFGTAPPKLAEEEVRAPADVPDNILVMEHGTLCRYSCEYLDKDTGEQVAGFEQTQIYGSPHISRGQYIEWIQFAGRKMMRLQYENGELGTFYLYWDDGEYRYNLIGSDEDLLLRLAESIEPRFSTDLS